MSSDLHSSYPSPIYKPASFIGNLLEWAKARHRDVMVAADVLHEIQWSTPWDDTRPVSPPSAKRPAP